MSGQKPTPSTATGGWGTAPTYALSNWKPESHKAPEGKPIIPELPTDTLLGDDGPTKGTKIENGTLFDLLPMDIINVIDECIIELEH